MPSYFVTSTGTDIGKTYVTCQLIRAARENGQTVKALKPVISGWPDGDYLNDAKVREAVEKSDTGQLLAAQGLDLTPGAIDACSPLRFREPLSPDMAAARENRSISFDHLVGICQQGIDNIGNEETFYIEGVGGVMVPVTDEKTVLDWMATLKIPTILVVGSYLGTLSHTLTATLALQSRNIKIHSVVISESEESPVPVEETATTLGRFLTEIAIETVIRSDVP